MTIARAIACLRPSRRTSTKEGELLQQTGDIFPTTPRRVRWQDFDSTKWLSVLSPRTLLPLSLGVILAACAGRVSTAGPVADSDVRSPTDDAIAPIEDSRLETPALDAALGCGGGMSNRALLVWR